MQQRHAPCAGLSTTVTAGVLMDVWYSVKLQLQHVTEKSEEDHLDVTAKQLFASRFIENSTYLKCTGVYTGICISLATT